MKNPGPLDENVYAVALASLEVDVLALEAIVAGRRNAAPRTMRESARRRLVHQRLTDMSRRINAVARTVYPAPVKQRGRR